MTTGDAYPPDLARFVQEHWISDPAVGATTVDFRTLEHLCSACYQASLLREEDRPVTFRAILATTEQFSPDGTPPLQVLAFHESLPLDAGELRRLSMAADTQQTLIGIHEDGNGELRIWGLINMGTRGLRETRGDRRIGPSLSDMPVVHADGPGSLSVYRGQVLVGRLRSGRLSEIRTDPFDSAWLPERFTDLQNDLIVGYDQAREQSGEMWAPLAPELPRMVSERMMKRVISLLREAGHGGTIIFLPTESSALPTESSYVDLKYRFATTTHQTFQDIIISILSRLAQIHHAGPRPNDVIEWPEFERAADVELATLEDTLFEQAQLIAGLASVDGAVVITKLHDLLGFGGMITGNLPVVRRVAKALDLNADTIVEEAVEKVGSRHRSAYSLVAASPEVVVIVVSQDGGVRFVAQKDGRVTYWEHES